MQLQIYSKSKLQAWASWEKHAGAAQEVSCYLTDCASVSTKGLELCVRADTKAAAGEGANHGYSADGEFEHLLAAHGDVFKRPAR